MSSSLSTGLTINSNSNIGFNSVGNMKCVDLHVANNVVTINESSDLSGGMLFTFSDASSVLITNNYNDLSYGSFCSQFGGFTTNTTGQYFTINLPPNTMCFINTIGSLTTNANIFQTASFFVCTKSTTQPNGTSTTLVSTGITANYNGGTNTFSIQGNTNYPVAYSVWCVGPVD